MFLYYLIAFTTLALFVWLVLKVDQASDTRRSRFSEAQFFAAALLCFFAFRWPVLLSGNALNPDEGQMVANALKATRDLVPWRGFDGTTSGPLNSDLLAIPALFGAHVDFFSARAIGGLLIVGSMIALYCAAKFIYGRFVARVAVVPPLVLLAFTTDLDFVHYSSEHLPIFLSSVGLAASTCLLLPSIRERHRIAVGALAGLCIGCIPFAKLQAAPLGLAICAYLVAAVLLRAPAGARARELAATFVGLCAPSIVIMGFVLSSGEWTDFLISYLRSAAAYLEWQAGTIGWPFYFGLLFQYTTYLTTSLITMALGIAFVIAGRPVLTRAIVAAAASSVLILAAALLSIYEAHHGFAHYLLLSVFPLAWCLANIIGLMRATKFGTVLERGLAGAYVAGFVIPALSGAFITPNFFLKDLASNLTWPRSDAAAEIARFANRGDSVAIWGWMPEYYVQTGTIMATRDAHTEHQIDAGPYQTYFRDRFLTDIAAHPPKVFVDAVAPTAFGFHDTATQGLESFPRLASFVHARYILAANVGGVRVYVTRLGAMEARSR